MKNLMLTIASAAILSSCSNENPLLSEFATPYGATPFDKIKNEHYMPAFKQGMEEGRKEIAAIVENTATATFNNTIEALEYSGTLLNRTSSIFFNLNEAETSAKMQAIAQEVVPLLTQYSNDISLNEKLFERVREVYNNADHAKLMPEQIMLLEKTYKSFTRKGANLNPENKTKYRALSEKLSMLTLDFKKNVLAATNAYSMTLTDANQLKGLPEGVVEEAAKVSQSKGIVGWTFTLQQPSYAPFLKYAENRELRKKLYIAYNTRGNNGDENDNNEIIAKIIATRLEIAELLGYKIYADYVLEERMAENVVNVNKLLNDLLSAAKPFAQKELAEVQRYAKRNGANFELQAYDWTFYAEKLKEEKYSINEETLRPYFEVQKVTNALFTLANKLWGINFRENDNLPVYHPDVKVYEVFDKDGTFLSLYYADLYPREGKRNGAWMNDIREQWKHNSTEQRPHIVNVCNFTKPTETKPALLTFYEFTTFLHEFGHGLHGILANGTYPSLTGTNVYRDFVELPSQIMENWAVEKEFLDMFAEHYQTGEKMPKELIEKIIASQNYLAGYATLRQLSFGVLDMAYHSIHQPLNESIADFEKKAISKIALLPQIDNCQVSHAFSHIFAGGYAAGYYSYKWAEVLEADAYSLFKKNGIFDTKTAQSFRDNILSQGGSEHPMTLYKRFRGQVPTVDALLIKSGFKQ
ncbi:MAG: M3 family metallopeptidase [Bacteroidales bacterium]